jgi:hypothetical protein
MSQRKATSEPVNETMQEMKSSPMSIPVSMCRKAQTNNVMIINAANRMLTTAKVMEDRMSFARR